MSHKKRVLEILKTGETLTRLQYAKRCGSSDLPKFISVLRADGWIIKKEVIKHINMYNEHTWYMKYKLGT